jgi:RNA polymerase sigma-70 factor, ECF subfamily
MEPDTNELVRRFCGGDMPAAEELINLHYEPIYGFLRRLCGSEADAQDLTQQTFCRLWKAAKTYAAKSTFSSWLHGIAWHVYADWRRSNGRSSSCRAEWWNEQMATDQRPDDAARQNDLAAIVYRSVESLAPELREPVHLHYYQGLTLQETADAMTIATSTVKYRLRQAMESLRNAVGEDRGNAAPKTAQVL